MLFVNVPQYKFNILCNIAVAPFVGAWIEMMQNCHIHSRLIWSLPSWERGLKFFPSQSILHPHSVAPFVGAWIEMLRPNVLRSLINVAPFVGAWIEILFWCSHQPPSRVAPFAGVWIEMMNTTRKTDTLKKSLPSRERGLKYM